MNIRGGNQVNLIWSDICLYSLLYLRRRYKGVVVIGASNFISKTVNPVVNFPVQGD